MPQDLIHQQSLLQTDLQKICDEIFAGQGDNFEKRGIECEVSLQNLESQIQSTLSVLREGCQAREQDVEDDAKGPEVISAAQYKGPGHHLQGDVL